MPTRTTALVLALLALAAGCVSDPPSQRDVARDEAGRVVDGGEVGSQKVRVGDCFGAVDSARLESVDVVRCEEPHVYEAFYDFDVDGDDHPGHEAIEILAEQRCLGAFEPYVGLAYAGSVYAISYFWPTEETWDGLDDRRVLCLLVRVDEQPVSGSAAGSAE